MHDRDGARSGHRLTSCGDCLEEFPGKTAQESADAARAHIEAGCPKARARETRVAADDLEVLLWG